MENKSWDILFIDDEADILLAIGEYLRRNGLTVLTAQDTTRALAQIDENKVSIVILDVHLADGENGLELISFLKMNHPGVRIIIYTGASDDANEVKKALARGADCYVYKSPALQELLFAIKQLRGNSAA